MKLKKENILLYVVTDRTWLGQNKLRDQVEEIIKSGATLLQVREKDLSFEEFVAEAKQIKNITERYGIPLIINDRIDVAIAVDADGVHLGQEDEDIKKAKEIFGADKIIGISAHNVEEALKAQNNGADYIGVGAVFSTSTKKDANTVAYETLQDICRAVTLPIVAIGGITEDNILNLSGSGVDGVAVISAIFASENVGKATDKMLGLAKKMISGR